MSYLKTSLNDGWKLGWKPDPVLNKWVVGFDTWSVEDGCLTGEPTSLTRALIYANCKAEGDCTTQFSFRFASEESEARPILCYSITRLSGYYLFLHPSRKICVYYVFSDLYDHAVLDDIGPELEVGKDYTLTAERCGSNVTLLLNGEKIGEFACVDPCGDYTALTVCAGHVSFREFQICSAEQEVLFKDDFAENSLPECAEVDPAEADSVSRWIDAPVPGTVQTALLNAGIIEDPYLPFNGEKMHWTTDQRWFYKKTFTVPADYRGKRLRLFFEGVDYRAHFWLNGQALCYHEGMFGGPEVDVTDLVDYENENELLVCILPCPNPPHANVRPYILHRWHFNMDIITAGLWRGVELIADERIFLTDPQVITRCIRKDGTAVLDLAVTLGTMALWPFDVTGRFVLHSPVEGEDDLSVSFAPGFCQGTFRVKCTLEVPNAHLWWPNGMGEQFLYDIDIFADLYEPLKQATTAHDELHLRTGIRTLRREPMPHVLATEQGAANNPYGLCNWCFTVNGKPFFGKGSNWMPIDNLLRLDKEHYRRLLLRAVDSHINILRPWGAGLLETDEFYDLCDELGILVWQETLFANGVYHHSKIDVWRDTIRRNVCRLRNHPALAIYCGGNEFDPDYVENKDIIAELTAMIAELDPTREFHPACPYGGDNHSYLVNWMGGKPYSYFTRDLSVAITEFSLASPPSMDTLKRLIPEEELAAFPPDLPDDIHRYDYTSWGRPVERKESSYSILDAHLSGITNIMFPPMSECGKPKSMDEFVTYLQTAQGLLTQFGIDFWRSRWPYCTLTMSWVFNVIFPDSMSWSYVDYFGVPKHSYYYQKRAYEPLHLTSSFDELFNPAGTTLRVKQAIINETPEALTGLTVRTRLYDSALCLLSEAEQSVNLRADDVRSCGFFTYDIPADAPDQVFFLCADLLDADGKLLSRSVTCPRVGTPEDRMPYLTDGPYIADVKAAETSLQAELAVQEDKLLLTVKNVGTLPAFEVTLHVAQKDDSLRYGDNCFWLDAGEQRTVEIRSFDELPERVEVSAWNAKPISAVREEDVNA